MVAKLVSDDEDMESPSITSRDLKLIPQAVGKEGLRMGMGAENQNCPSYSEWNSVWKEIRGD